MKKKKLQINIFLLAIMLIAYLSFSGCSPTKPDDLNKVNCNVVLSQNEAFQCDNYIQKVKKGEDAVFELKFKNGNEFNAVDYENFNVSDMQNPDKEGNRKVTLTLKNVRYSRNIEIETKESEKVFFITLAENEKYECKDNVKMSNVKSDVVFEMYFDADYTFNSVDYAGGYEFVGADSDVNESGKRLVKLTLKKIYDSVTLNVQTKKIDSEDESTKDSTLIKYNINGGRLIDGNTGNSYSTNYQLLSKPRPNTSIGSDMITRDGFVLYGWNTAKDGSGEHIGLGSRSNIKIGETQNLYAQWSKWTDVKYFDYELINSQDVQKLYSTKADKKSLKELVLERNSSELTAVITKYNDSDLKVVTLPELLGGYPVAAIGKDAFYYKHNIQTVILPKTIMYLEMAAFNYCLNFTEVYLSDNIESIDETAFGYEPSVETLHINAVLPPVYGVTENGQLGNKIEMLINHDKNKPKMVFFAGCSIFYGLNSVQVYEAFNSKFDIFNLGVIGGTCALYQIDLIRQYMNKNDIFIHTPETASIFQLLGKSNFDSRVYVTLECNFDLFASLNLKDYSNVWGAFNEYLIGKRTLMSSVDYEQLTYEDSIDYMNGYGDLTNYRGGGFDNEGTPYEIETTANINNFKVVEKMNDCYRKFTRKGISVYFGYSPFNSDGIVGNSRYDFESLLIKNFKQHNVPATIFMSIDDCIFDKKYFYDTNYHLSTDGTKVYTSRLIERLKTYLK